MFTVPQPITVVAVKDFISDEVHIVGKASGNPRAVLSFVAVDDKGEIVPNAPVAEVTLTGEAYNKFYDEWKDETSIYVSLLAMLTSKTPGMEVSGVDLAKVVGMLSTTTAPEVVAQP